VTTKFRLCKTSDFSQGFYCTCALYIRVNANQSHFAYIDYCNIENTDTELKFKYFNSKTRPSRNLYKDLNCNTIFDATDETKHDWNKVPVSFKYFKCARLDIKDSTTFLVYIIRYDSKLFQIYLIF